MNDQCSQTTADKAYHHATHAHKIIERNREAQSSKGYHRLYDGHLTHSAQPLEHSTLSLCQEEAYHHGNHGHHLRPMTELLIEQYITDQRREQCAQSHRDDGSQQYPRTHHHYELLNTMGISHMKQLTGLASGIERYTQIAAANHKLRDGIIYGDETYTLATQEDGRELVADYRHQELEDLHSTKDSCVFDYMIVGIMLFTLG